MQRHSLSRDGRVVIGAVASVAAGAGIAVHARQTARRVETADTYLRRAFAESEASRHKLAAANEALARANVELRVIHTAFADLLNLADERSGGRMRELIEDAGDDLAQLLEEKIGPARCA